MPKKIRLNRAGFKEINHKDAHRLSGALVTLSFSPVISSEGSRCSCVVSKKVSLSAVVRNRIKRKCRAALQDELPQLKRPLIIILYAKKEAIKASFEELKKDIRSLIQRVG